MPDGTTSKADALTLAALLERWADAIPQRESYPKERWDAFAERRYQAEKALESRLRQLPSCQLSLGPGGSKVDLTLAGIRVRRQNCLANACRAWAAEIRRRARP